MNLFPVSDPIQVISADGDVRYFGQVLDLEMTQAYFMKLMDKVKWETDKGIFYGKRYETKRKVAWYGEKDFVYNYSHDTKKALFWIKELKELKAICENTTGATYNSCLLNLYHSGDEGLSWHSDNEKVLAKGGSIASLSLGATRKFMFKHKMTGQKKTIILEAGSLLEMRGNTQENWLHSIPKTKKVKTERINLTFRQYVIN